MNALISAAILLAAAAAPAQPNPRAPADALPPTATPAQVVAPAKTWFSPNQPVEINVKASGDATLVLTDFAGKEIEAKEEAAVGGEATVDLKKVFPQVANAGTYVLYVRPKGGDAGQFEGTPLVVSVRSDARRGAPAGPMVTKIEPLRYAVMQTAYGPITMAFYYDVAPNTADNFLSLAAGGYFDGLTFHRIVPGFVIQGGDPRGDGTGGPGYQIDAEFNERPHLEGVLSMARSGDPNSAGSQFFICLDYNGTKSLDRQYTAFGKVTDGMEAVKAIAGVELADKQTGSPKQPQVIKKVEVKPVTAEENPYRAMMNAGAPGGAGGAAAPAGDAKQ